MKKKIVIVVAFICAVAVVGMMVGFTASRGDGSDDVSALRTITLEREDLVRAVSATGTVYSTDSTAVYSNLNYPVKTVYAAVGDRVTEGDLLAELDTASLQSDIAQKRASVGASQATAQQSLLSAQKDLDTYRNNAAGGYDSNLLSAESAVTTAELDVQTAELDIQTATIEVRTARNNLSDARSDDGDYEEQAATDSQLAALRDTLSARETSLEKAQSALEKAQANLEKAKNNLEATKVSTDDSVATYEQKVKSAQLSTNFNDQWIAIQSMESDLLSGTVTAPVSGVVTAVDAVEGGSGSGQLFVIQKADALKVITNIKEYDIEAVTIGDKVTIKTDATGDAVFAGTLSRIAPTSTLTATGDTTTSTDAEYESEVTVSTAAGGLRIGMNARLSIITDERKNVYAVPYEAVETDADGGSFVYVVVAGEKGSVVETVPVEKGMENDLYVEISGDGLVDGLQVVKNAQSVSADSVNTAALPALGDSGSAESEAAA